jgi:hypothetical protein
VNERRITTAIVAVLVGTAVCFRLLHLGSIPGINGDEGWWGVQATHWLHGQPYQATTTSGNPIDMFLLVPLGLVHGLAPPSFVLLRIIPATVNLLALAVGFVLVRRLYDETTAWIQTITLAILPTAISHSRFCQDPSQSIPWTGLVVYLSLLGLQERRRAWLYAAGVILLFPVAIWTHPTNVFIAPFVLLPVAAAAAPLVPRSRRGRTIVVAVTAGLVIVAAAAALPSLSHYAASNAFLNRPWLSVAGARLTHIAAWYEFLKNYIRLFDGVTIYHYFVDPHAISRASDIGFGLVFVVVAWGLRLALQEPRPADAGLVFAWVSMCLLFFAFGGPEAIRPHAERWGLCLIAPGTVVIARAFAAVIARAPARRAWTIGAAAAAAAGLLGSFYLNYFREFETSGGRSHITFITAATEPKQQALEQVLAKRTAGEPVLIVAQQWWQFWPITYLAQAHPEVTVTMTLPPDDRPELQEALARGRLFFVEFTGSEELTRAIDWIRGHGYQSAETVVHDAGGHDLLTVLQVAPPPSR